MTDPVPTGRPAAELSDEELETQGKQLHDSRNWVFLHGSAAQFETHTQRMIALEQEYLRRFPKRTWQGLEDAGDVVATTDVDDPVRALLQAVSDAGGRMHKLEVHQIAGRVRKQRGDVIHARVLAMHGPERVVHVIVGEVGEALRVAGPLVGVLRGLGRIEADVLEQYDVGIGDVGLG